ncbi:DUF6086 family protein [Nocardia sp. NPDC058705]|uniref:DUF6086 family protein n=1 Tax=Nocardia sp. NPDC058705 TaxID=3346609 RepID=UPI0036C593C0
MSQYFEAGGQTVWNPSNGASRLFLRQLRSFEEELGVPSGIGPMEADECEITPAVLEEFVAALLTWRAGTDHAVVQVLSDGFIATVTVIAERAGIDVAWRLLARDSGVRECAHRLDRHMAR